jgi:hypothetical protein
VQNVIKGNIPKGNVEIITTKSNFIDEKGNRVTVKDNNPAIFKGKAIYFCADIENAKKLEYELSFYSKQTQSINTKTLISLDGASIIDDKISTHRPYTALEYFASISEFYNYLSTNYGIKIDKSLLEKKSLNISTPNKIQQNYQDRKSVSKIILTSTGSLKKPKSAVGNNFTTTNQNQKN